MKDKGSTISNDKGKAGGLMRKFTTYELLILTVEKKA